MPPRRFILIMLTGLALGALPLLAVHPAAPSSTTIPWYRSGTGWLGMVGLFWTAIAGFIATILTVGLAARMRSVSTLLFGLVLAAGTVYLVRLYFRALF